MRMEDLRFSKSLGFSEFFTIVCPSSRREGLLWHGHEYKQHGLEDFDPSLISIFQLEGKFRNLCQNISTLLSLRLGLTTKTLGSRDDLSGLC